MASFFDVEQLEGIEAPDQRNVEPMRVRQLADEELVRAERRQRDEFMPIANRAIRDFPAAAKQAGLPSTPIKVKRVGVPHKTRVWELFTYDNHEGARWTYYISEAGTVYEDFQSLGEYARSSVGKAAEALYKSESNAGGSGVPGVIDQPLEDAIRSRLVSALHGHPRG